MTRRRDSQKARTRSRLIECAHGVFLRHGFHAATLEQIAREADVTKGAYCRFDPEAARQLAELLRAVAVYAAGGMSALEARQDAGAVKLLSQMR